MTMPAMSLVEIDVLALPVSEAYKLIIGTIVPRPIAWVSTIDSQGRTNLAPYSFFNGVCSNPPSLLFCPVAHPDGREKDTLRNIRESKQFVVNIANEELAGVMNATSANYPAGTSEFAECGVTSEPSRRVRPPRVREAPASFECELIQIVPIGNGGPGSGSIVIGKIVYAVYIDKVYDRGKIRTNELKPVARLGGTSYCPVRGIFDLPRPTLK